MGRLNTTYYCALDSATCLSDKEWLGSLLVGTHYLSAFHLSILEILNGIGVKCKTGQEYAFLQ